MRTDLLRRFKKFVSEEKLFVPDDHILLAVSGGMDSVSMCHLFFLARYKFTIAHCNFHLRDEDSNKDAVFVKQLAEKYKVCFFQKDFNTTEYATQQGISIEMAARQQRYDWFNELLEKHNFYSVATAHHLDDSIETVLINLVRGTGIAGLHGILPKHNSIIRPLVFATREEIEQFVKAEQLSFRQDLSNHSVIFQRNKIRHEIIPVLKSINPAFVQTMQANINRFKDTEKIVRSVIEKNIPSLIKIKNNKTSISIRKLNRLGTVEVYLYELLNKFNFNSSVIHDIANSLNDISGKQFFSPDYRLIKDRQHLILGKIKQENLNNTFWVQAENSSIHKPVKLKISFMKGKNHTLSKEKNIADIDQDKIKFPLLIRRWQRGDAFYPLGMKQEKKLSDFFIDNKLSLSEKENSWLLCSDNKIVWVIGQRLDNRFKITSATKNILRIRFTK